MSCRSVLLLLVLAACGRPRPAVEAGAAASVADTVAEGTVRVVGPAESADVILHGATASAGLMGPLGGELRRLSGATLRVTGTPRNNSEPVPPRAVLVSDYEVLEVDGERPLVGTLLSRDGHLWLAGETPSSWSPTCPTSRRGRAPGCSCWVRAKATASGSSPMA